MLRKKLSSTFDKIMRDPIGYADTAIVICTEQLKTVKSEKRKNSLISKIESWNLFRNQYFAEKEKIQQQKQIQEAATNEKSDTVGGNLSTEENK